MNNDIESHIITKRLTGLPDCIRRELVAARHSHGWSQRDLAARVGLPQVHISAIETGKVTPRFNTLLDLVRILDFDLLLVPRPLVPAVQSLVRDHRRPDSSGDGELPLYADETESEEA